jgi:hypothetical protein
VHTSTITSSYISNCSKNDIKPHQDTILDKYILPTIQKFTQVTKKLIKHSRHFSDTAGSSTGQLIHQMVHKVHYCFHNSPALEAAMS